MVNKHYHLGEEAHLFQVLEVLVTLPQGSTRLDENHWIGPADADQPARMLTYKVTDRQYVGDKIIEELGPLAVWHMGGLLRVTVSPFEKRQRRALRRTAKHLKKIIAQYSESRYPTKADQGSFSHYSM